MKDRYLKTFLCGSSVSLFGAGVLGIVNYLIRRTLCYNMTLTDYGTFYSTFALLFMIFSFTDLGLTQSGTVMIASANEDPDQRNAIFTHIFLIKGLLAVICSAVIFACFQITHNSLDSVFLLIFLCYFVAQIIMSSLHTLWGGLKKFHIQQAAYIAIALITLSLLYILKKFDLRFVSTAFLSSVIVVFISGLIYSKSNNLGSIKLRTDKKLFKKLLTMGSQIAITTTLLNVMYYMDTVMLNALKGPQSAGLYNVALPIMQIVQATMIFPAVILPIAVEMKKNNEYTKLLKVVRYSLLLAIAAVVPVAVFFHYCSPWLIQFLFKPEYVTISSTVTILCTGLVFFTLGNLLFQIIICLQKNICIIIIATFSVIVNLLLNYYLILKMDINGAAYATFISYAIFAISTYITLEFSLSKQKQNENKMETRH